MITNAKMKNFVAVLIVALSFFACKKNIPPMVTISNSISVTQTTANVTGNVTDEGGTQVTDRGFVYGKQGGKQDTAYCGNGGGEFPTRLTGLEAGSTYECMAFARNSGGTSFSGKVSFTTLPVSKPEVTTGEPTNISLTSATGIGFVNNDGGSEVTERGLCWGTTPTPTTSNSHQSSGSGTGEFEVNITGLTANTTYQVRAYATNSKGTEYGNIVTFKTLDPNLPVVTTAEVSNITVSTAKCGGSVTLQNGTSVSAKGVCWSTSQNPTISGSHTTDGTSVGSFTSNITGLTANTTYYVRAYATKNNTTVYGNQVSFNTLNGTTVTLTAGDVWGDGSGYQMLLDANATAYGNTIPTTGPLTSSGNASASVYSVFEYKIPTNADGACSTSHIVFNNSVSITIPAGTYDWCITNPTPGDRVWIASENGNVDGRADNFVFQNGRSYEFKVTMDGSEDRVDLYVDGSLLKSIPIKSTAGNIVKHKVTSK